MWPYRGRASEPEVLPPAPLATGVPTVKPVTYAVPDLHGRADLLELAIEAITARGGGTVVFLGDYVDRGHTSRQVIQRLMAGPPDGQRWICLGGNHESMLYVCYTGMAARGIWLENGGDATLRSYGGVIPPEDLRWIQVRPLIHVTEHRVFVHASVDPTIPLAAQTDDTLQWQRYPKGFAEGHGSLHVVHGHTPNTKGPELYSGRTNLDTLAWKTGRLAVGVFNDATPGGPTEILWVEGYAFVHLLREGAGPMAVAEVTPEPVNS